MALFCVQNCSATAASPNDGAESDGTESSLPAARSFTVTVVAALARDPPALTVNSNVSAVVPATCGAVNFGPAVPASVRTTCGPPPLCLQA